MGLSPDNYSSLEEQAAATEASEIPPAQVKDETKPAEEAKPTTPVCDGCCCDCTKTDEVK